MPGGLLEGVEFDEDNFSMGTIPLRLGGVKVYKSGGDEAILEAPAVWGSDCRVRRPGYTAALTSCMSGPRCDPPS